MERKTHYKSLVSIFLCLMCIGLSHAQYDILITPGTTTVDGCIHPTGTIIDNGGPLNGYDPMIGQVVITAPEGMRVAISGGYRISYYDTLYIYDGNDSLNLQIFRNEGSISCTSATSSLTIGLHSHIPSFAYYWGFQLHYQLVGTDSNECHQRPTDLEISYPNDSSIMLRWRSVLSTGPFWFMWDGVNEQWTSTTKLKTGLSPGQSHTVWVSSLIDSLSPCCSLIKRVKTTCGRITRNDLPYHYGFEDASGEGESQHISSCWTTDNGLLSKAYPTSQARMGSYALVLESSDPNGYAIAALPYYEGNVNETMLDFWLFSSSNIPIEVGVMDNPYEMETFELVGSVRTVGQDYEHKQVSMRGYSGSGHYIVLRTHQGPSQQHLVDDVRLVLASVCPEVTELHIDQANFSSLAVAWDIAGDESRVSSYEVRVTPEEGGTPMVVTATESPHILSGLAPAQSYTIEVRSVCRTGGRGNWVSTVGHTHDLCPGQSSASDVYCMPNQQVPVYNFAGNSVCQSIYTAEHLREMGLHSGPINEITYSWSTNGSMEKEFSIYLTTTEINDYIEANYTPITEGHTLVYSGTHPQNTFGSHTYTFSTPYYWDGASNLVVTTLMNQPSGENHSSSNFGGESHERDSVVTMWYGRDNQAFSIDQLSSLALVPCSYQPCIKLYSCATSSDCQTPLVMVREVGTTEATLFWSMDSNVNSWDIAYHIQRDSVWHTVQTNYTGHEYRFTQLTPSTTYLFRVTAVCDSGTVAGQAKAKTLCKEHPLIYDDLYADNVICYYGIFSDPRRNMGIVNDGPAAMSSRHTVHIDIDETDPRTGGQLHTVPEGYCSSVRLGNYDVNAMAESITYILDIDTSEYDLLLLKYAAVMENPNHPDEYQPRFTFDITDMEGNLISNCYSADFIANSSLGWNLYAPSFYQPILWKDWTTVGIDLVPLQGWTIKVNLTTYDCSAGGHFGYAYFVMDLDNKKIVSRNCSTVENVFRAPAGFSYRWYSETDTTTLSDSDTLHVINAGKYYCDLSFVGAPNDSIHADCHFTLSAIASLRHPYARFSIDSTDANPCYHASLKMKNTSIITSDAAHHDSIANGCESYLWDFGDGTTSTERNPTHVFRPGTYTIKLYAKLADGACTDSAELKYTHINNCVRYDTAYRTMCEGETLWMFDSVLTMAGTYQLDSIIEGDSVITRTLYLTTLNTSSSELWIAKCDSYFWTESSQTYTESGLYADTLTNAVGCDSIVSLHLTIDSSYDIHFYDTIYLDDTIMFEGTEYHSPGVYVFHLTTQSGCDSTRTLHLEQKALVLDSLSAIICEGTEYLFIDTLLTTTGVYNRFSRTEDLSVPDTLWNLTLTVKSQPQIDIESSHTCLDNPHYTLEAHSSLPFYYWYSTPADPDIAGMEDDSVISVNSLQTTTYYVRTEYADDPKCPSYDSIELYPIEALTAWIEVNPTQLMNAERSLTAICRTHGRADRYEWYLWYNQNPPFLYDTSAEITVEVPAYVDSLSITVTASNQTCFDSDSVAIPIIQSELFFPNVFTPNLESNNLFRAYYTKINDYEIWIYDRRGDLVYHSTDLTSGWDGTHEGRPCVQGAYVYTCTYRDAITPGGIMRKTGTVVLVR